MGAKKTIGGVFLTEFQLPSAQEKPDFSVLISPAFLQSNPTVSTQSFQILVAVFLAAKNSVVIPWICHPMHSVS